MRARRQPTCGLYGPHVTLYSEPKVRRSEKHAMEAAFP